MTTLVKITVAYLVALFLASCAFDITIGDGKKGNGTVVEESRAIIEEFTVITASEGLDVYVTQADEFSITVEADENIIDRIGTDIKDGKLRIHAIENIGRATKKIHVSLPEITALESSSGADLIVKNTIESEQIKLGASSGSDISADVRAHEVYTNASSGADIELTGETANLHANASSGADIKAVELLAETCWARASSGADISVNVTNVLTADASSGGNVSYTGLAVVERKNSVSGSITKM